MSTLYSAAKLVVEKELDLEEEVFIQDAEMLEYFNKARREAEAEILGIYEDYFLDKTNLALVTGTSRYNLPSGIYVNKIRGIIYDTGSITYEIKQIRSMKKFLERALLISASPTDYYRYLILNNATNGIQIELTPPSKETSSTNVTIWFWRVVADLTGAALDTVDGDMPGTLNFIYAYVRGLCKQKENAGSMPQDAAAEIMAQKKLMIDTLTNKIPDDDNTVICDMSFYEEMS